MKKHNVGAKKACTAMKWEHVKPTTLDSRRSGASKASMHGAQMKILTLAEEEQLCIWIKVQALNAGGANRQAVESKVIEIIKLRQATQKAAGITGGRKFVALSPPARAALSAEHLGPKWVKQLYKRHQTILKERCQTIVARRCRKQSGLVLLAQLGPGGGEEEGGEGERGTAQEAEEVGR